MSNRKNERKNAPSAKERTDLDRGEGMKKETEGRRFPDACAKDSHSFGD